MKTKIEWCDHVWNVVTGCTKVSAGCANCYAESNAKRFWGERKFSDIQMHPERLSMPANIKKPSRIFVNSMSDLFHEKVSFDFIDQVFDVMWENSKHTFLILTKRPERMCEYIRERAHKKSFGWSPEERTPFSPNSIHHIDDISMRNECGYVANSRSNNGYGCNHPGNDDRYELEPDELKDHDEEEYTVLDSDNSEGRCFCFSCPIAYEVTDRNTLAEHDLDGDYEFDDDGYTNDTDWMQFHQRPKDAAVKNVWLGVSVENQEQYDKRIHTLCDIKMSLGYYFKVFLSIEPLLGPIDFNTTEEPKEWYEDSPEIRGKYSEAPRDWNPLHPVDYTDGYAVENEEQYKLPLIDWVIVGGESGHKARPMNPEWVRSIRDQCVKANVPFFFKQWGEWAVRAGLHDCGKDWESIDPYGKSGKIIDINDADGIHLCYMQKLGKKKSGRILDGREWNQFPGETK